MDYPLFYVSIKVAKDLVLRTSFGDEQVIEAAWYAKIEIVDALRSSTNNK